MTRWQQQIKKSIKNITSLCKLLYHAHDSNSLQVHLLIKQFSNVANNQFPLLVPQPFAQRIEIGKPSDPLLLQVLPTSSENNKISGFTNDPLEEKQYTPIPGLIHKYHGRVLLLITNKCSINCRFCFRRHSNQSVCEWSDVIRYITKNKSISEVILSGGDPLMLDDNKLKKILTLLTKIPTIKRIRIHTRMPITVPERITHQLLNTLQISKNKLVIVTHCNHPNEIDQTVISTCKKIHANGIVLLNQTVILKQINDNASTLITLSEKLLTARILPYYLHVLDKVTGSGHFYVPAQSIHKIQLELMKKLPGYLVPKIVIDKPHRFAKQLFDDLYK